MSRLTSALALAAWLLLAGTGASQAMAQPFCNSSSCSLSAGATSSQIYFEMGRNTPLKLICWTDNEWYRGTNRWFKVSSVYGNGYVSAAQVGGQTRVGRC